MSTPEDLHPDTDVRPDDSGGNPETPMNPTRFQGVSDLVRNEVLAASIALIAVGFIAAVLDAPLGGPADPAGIPESHVKAPWIFVGIQQMLRLLNPLFAGVVLPMTALILLGLLPFISPRRRMLTFATFFAITVASVVITVWGFLA